MKSEIRYADAGSMRVFILSDQDWLYWAAHEVDLVPVNVLTGQLLSGTPTSPAAN